MEHAFFSIGAVVFSPIAVIIQGTVHVLYCWKVIGDGGVNSVACESS